MTTRADVARLAKVSESTVSYVLSGKRSISEGTKQRVMAAIDQTGYKSNYAAAVLAGGTSRIVTMMISNLFSPDSARLNGILVDGVVAGVQGSGLHSIIWPITGQGDSDVQELLASNFSGGVVLMNVGPNDRRVHYLHEHRVPFVVLGRTNVKFEYNFVDRDFDQVYEIALKHLDDLGHEEIGVMQYGKTLPTSFRRVATRLNLKLTVIDTVNSPDGGRNIAKNFKNDFPTVTAVVSRMNVATLEFVNSAKEFGISIPQDLSIIGVNVLNAQAEEADPQITSVSLDASEIAFSCGKMMVDVIENGDSSSGTRGELWVGDLIDRGSTAMKRRKEKI